MCSRQTFPCVPNYNLLTGAFVITGFKLGFNYFLRTKGEKEEFHGNITIQAHALSIILNIYA